MIAIVVIGVDGDAVLAAKLFLQLPMDFVREIG
jgi:hypothetical protein